MNKKLHKGEMPCLSLNVTVLFKAWSFSVVFPEVVHCGKQLNNYYINNYKIKSRS